MSTDAKETQSKAIEDVQKETGKPQDNKKEKVYFKRTSENFFFLISDVAWKDKETEEFNEPRRTIQIGGRKSFVTRKRGYLTLPNTKQAVEEFKEFILPQWEKGAIDSESSSGPLEVNNMDDL